MSIASRRTMAPSGRSLLGATLAILLVSTTAGFAQSLGDAARREELRRQTIKTSGPAYDNRDLNRPIQPEMRSAPDPVGTSTPMAIDPVLPAETGRAPAIPS